jgi:ABC-2 type transport system ATP-binding protein
MEPLVEVEDLHKCFPQGSPLRMLFGRSLPSLEVLRGVDLRVERGDLVALLGANGAGKTTLLKTIATLLAPSAGSVRVGGYDVVTRAHQARGLVGYVLADERSFHWRLSARENLEFFAALDGISPAEARSRIRALLDRLQLLDVADRRFAEFSTGMKQRLAIARALLARPRVLLMDEPTRSIDATHAAEVWRLVREEIHEIEGCVVLVTHQVQEALSLCGRLAILEQGQIAVDTTAPRLESLTSGLDGFTVSVRGLAADDLQSLRGFVGVRDIRVASQVAGEQVLEVWTRNGDLPLAGFIGELTGMGATICSLQRATPLRGVLERLAAGNGKARV